MDSFDLFPDVDLGADTDVRNGCVRPIGRLSGRTPRPMVGARRAPSTAALLREIRGHPKERARQRRGAAAPDIAQTPALLALSRRA
jgi:hypothetical protein